MRRKYAPLLIVYVLSLAMLGYLSYAHDVHPYGYNYDVPEENTVEVKQGIINTETHLFDANEVNPIPVMLGIDKLIHNWIIFLYIVPLFIAGLLGFLKMELRWNLKLRTYTAIYLSLLVIVSTVGILFFKNQGSDILTLLIELNKNA